MKIGYMRVSKADGSQKFDLQLDALKAAGVDEKNIFEDKISGAKAVRPGLEMCMRALRKGDILVIWRLDRLGRNTRHLLNLTEEIKEKGVDLLILSGQGKGLDTSTPVGQLFFQIMAMLSEYEREIIRERTIAGIEAARARGLNGGRKFKLTKNQLYMAKNMMGKKETNVSELCRDLKITRATLYRYIDPSGEFRPPAHAILEK